MQDIKTTKVHVKTKGSFTIEYEESDGYLVSIEKITQTMDEGRMFRVIEEPSRKLYASLVDAVQEEINKQ